MWSNLLLLLAINVQGATLDANLQGGMDTYAADPTPAVGVQGDLRLRGSERVQDLPSYDLRVRGHWQEGAKGDWNVDPDPLVTRLDYGKGHVFLGRTHPHLENRGQVPSHTSALGSVWVQNQTQPLNPRVSGWLGGGTKLNWTSSLSTTVQYSPVFIPNFGPKLGFLDSGEVEGSRFTKLPPSKVLVNGQELPIRYTLDTGNILDIVLQHQGYVETQYRKGILGVGVFAMTAPKPEPEVEALGKLRVNDSSVDVHVTALPKFPRETWLGSQVQVGPSLTSAVFETTSQAWVLSTQVTPVRALTLGGLHRMQPAPEEPPLLVSPVYSRALVFADLGAQLSHFRPSLRVERHLLNGERDLRLSPSLRYSPLPNLYALAQAHILTGEDTSYYGAWRHLDTLSLNMGYTW